MTDFFWICYCILMFCLAALIIALVGPHLAQAHEAIKTAAQPNGWTYPWACCSNMDCRMLDHAGVKERPEGYVIDSTGEVIAYVDTRIKDSPDGEYHWCAHQEGIAAGKTICLFVPPKGF